MPRSRALFTAPIVLAIVIVGIFAIRSRSSDNSDDLNTTKSRDCAPVARADAVATKPATPIAIDVLANDTDADGDPLVFQIIKTEGGDSAIDDGGTPTDASDDRVLFTPANPAPASATIDYQAVDPNGAVDESVVKVSINPEGALPVGARSEAADEANSTSGDCGAAPRSTSTTKGNDTVTSTPPFTGSLTGTTVKRSSKNRARSGGRTTTTMRRETVGGSPTTRAPNPPTTHTTSPPTTHTTSPPTTTDNSPPPTTPPQCGAFPSGGSDEEKDAWRQCVRDNADG
ncbi:MAG TPA: Ig-like domain-containing protein [Acidimicrobiales bacterium]|nr:Ig-like domain-containing protein [Acidimicrobiales bacterium]